MTDPTSDELERILTEFSEYCRGVYQGIEDYDRTTAKAAILALMESRVNEEVRKTLRIVKGRIETASYDYTQVLPEGSVDWVLALSPKTESKHGESATFKTEDK